MRDSVKKSRQANIIGILVMNFKAQHRFKKREMIRRDRV